MKCCRGGVWGVEAPPGISVTRALLPEFRTRTEDKIDNMLNSWEKRQSVHDKGSSSGSANDFLMNFYAPRMPPTIVREMFANIFMNFRDIVCEFLAIFAATAAAGASARLGGRGNSGRLGLATAVGSRRGGGPKN